MQHVSVEPEMKYPVIRGRAILLGLASQLSEYCWASAMGTKVRI